MCGFLGELGWSVLNANVENEMKRENGRIQEEREDRSSIMCWEMKRQERIRKLRVEKRIGSDHQPMTIWVERGGSGGGRGIRKKREGKSVWTDKRRKRFEKYFGKKDEEGKEVEGG